ncbi:MAG: glycosyl hydrolase, partial [Silvibacterium sp.]
MKVKTGKSDGARNPLMVAAVFLLALFASSATAQNTTDPLLGAFQSPPESARPRVWWHWMNGNITKEGIQLDEEWMKRVGLAGFQNFDAALSTPQVVKERLVYMTPPWKDAFKFAITTGVNLDMEMAIAGSPGWSETGGPWVPASEGMKKYVWSETEVEGGKPFTGKLAHPPQVTGAFQNLGVRDELAAAEGSAAIPSFYADGPVIAYRRAADDVPVESLHPKVTSSGGSPDIAMLSDGDLVKTTKLPIPKSAGDKAWIQWEFAEPQTIRAVTIVVPELGQFAAIAGLSDPEKAVEVSDDGQNFREIAKLVHGGAPEHTIAFAPVKAKYFRVTFKRTPPPPIPAWAAGIDFASMGIKIPPPPTDYDIAELVLHTGGRVNRFEEKAAFTPVPDLYQFAT